MKDLTQLDDLLHDFAVNLHPYAIGKGQPSDYEKYKTQTVAAIKSLMLDVVGKSERRIAKRPTMTRRQARNELRAEQRARISKL